MNGPGMMMVAAAVLLIAVVGTVAVYFGVKRYKGRGH